MGRGSASRYFRRAAAEQCAVNMPADALLQSNAQCHLAVDDPPGDFPGTARIPLKLIHEIIQSQLSGLPGSALFERELNRKRRGGITVHAIDTEIGPDMPGLPIRIEESANAVFSDLCAPSQLVS